MSFLCAFCHQIYNLVCFFSLDNRTFLFSFYRNCCNKSASPSDSRLSPINLVRICCRLDFIVVDLVNPNTLHHVSAVLGTRHCCSPLPDLPPTHPSSLLEFFSWKIVFPFPVCCGEICLYSVFELLQFSNYFFRSGLFVLL